MAASCRCRASFRAASSTATELWLSAGDTAKVSGIYRMLGKDQAKLASAKAGDTVALGKLEGVRTGHTLTSAKGGVAPLIAVEPPQPVYAFSLRPKERKDEVKMSAAIQRLAEEDPSLSLHHNQDSGETVLSGHGEMHLRVVRERLEGKNQIAVEGRPPQVPYRETIRKAASQRGRHKKQSGGHGQFGDVVIDIKPLPRGSGFKFTDTITGGVVPKQYIQSVETGVRDYLKSGPLGFPVVDIAGEPLGRFLPFGRFLRHGVPDGGQDRHEGRHGAVLAGAAGAGDEGRDLHALPTPRPRSPGWCRSGAARSSATTRGPAGRGGTWSRRRCRNRRSAI